MHYHPSPKVRWPVGLAGQDPGLTRHRNQTLGALCCADDGVASHRRQAHRWAFLLGDFSLVVSKVCVAAILSLLSSTPFLWGPRMEQETMGYPLSFEDPHGLMVGAKVVSQKKMAGWDQGRMPSETVQLKRRWNSIGVLVL